MSLTELQINVTAKLRFWVTDDQATFVTGLLDGAFTKTLRHDTSSSAQTVTVTELASGEYEATFTPNSLGVWSIRVSHSVYGSWGGAFRVVTRLNDDFAYPATSGRSLAVSAAGAVDANLAAGAITSSTFAAGAIDAAAIATDAIGSAELAASAVTKIQTAVAAGAVASVTGAVGSVTGAVGSVTGDVGGKVLGGGAGTITGTGARADVRAWNGTAPSNLVSGRVDVTVGAMQTDTLDANALKADAATEIATAVAAPSAATIASAVANEALSGHTTAGSLGEALLRLRETILASGTLQSSGVLAAGSSSDDQAYRGALLIPTGGTGAGQNGKVIVTYNGTTKAFTTYQNFGTALDNTTTSVILSVADYARYVGDVLGSVTTLSAGAITASSISAGAITASKIATDAIGAAQLAADAVAEIQSGLATAAAVAAIPTTSAPTANQNADALLDRAAAIDGATPRVTLARIAATSHGTISGMASGTPTILGQDGATVRVEAVVDADGNRTSVSTP